jgi:hypothetical protein
LSILIHSVCDSVNVRTSLANSLVHNIIKKGDFLDFSFYVLYTTLLHLASLKFHGVGECWDRSQNCCDFGIDSQTPLG